MPVHGCALQAAVTVSARDSGMRQPAALSRQSLLQAAAGGSDGIRGAELAAGPGQERESRGRPPASRGEGRTSQPPGCNSPGLYNAMTLFGLN